MSLIYKLGKKPASPLKKKAIHYSDVLNLQKLPTPPKVFGNQRMITTWGMFGNDEFGDCVWVTKANNQQLWSRMGQHARTRFSTFGVLSDYAACTGFVASDPDSDQGTDMKLAAEYHRKIGVIDANKIRHRVNSYVNNSPGDLDQIDVAAYIFGSCEIGVLISNDNMEQFDKGEPWVISGTPIGGHCIPIIARDADGFYLCVTWGKLQRIHRDFLIKQMDEGITYLNKEILNRAGILSTSAFNEKRLEDMLKQISPQVFAQEIPSDENIRYGLLSNSGPQPNADQYEVALRTMRKWADKSGYGWYIGDDKLKPVADEVAQAVVQAGQE